MNEYLFNQNLVVFSSCAAVIASLYFVRQYRAKKLPWRSLSLQIVIAAVLWIAEIQLVSHTFGLQDVPVAGYYLTALTTLWLVLTIGSFRNLKRLGFGVAATLLTGMLLVVTINDYYQYYPTIGSLFSPMHKQTDAFSSVTVNRQNVKYGVNSIEKTLYSGVQSKGTIMAATIPGTQSGLKARESYVYLPPAYNEAIVRDMKFPVLILLTGTPGTPSSWLQGGIFEDIMNGFAAHHQGLSPIVVITDHSGSFTNDTECLNSAHGNAETYLTVDVPAYIKGHFRVSGDPVNWGIGGFSEGGMCSAMLTLEHQDVFRHFLDLAGDPMPYLNNSNQTLPVLFHGSVTEQKQHNIDWLLQNKPINFGLTGQFAIGADDNKHLISEMRQTYHLANKRKIPGSFEQIAHAGHSFQAWSEGYRDALPRLSFYLGATDCETTCTP